MATVKSLNKWANAHTYYPLDLVRIALGVFLFMKGVDFMSNHAQMVEMIKPFQNMPGGMIIMHYVAPAHFVGGFLLIIGLLTRWVVIAQLPIIIGAILVNFLGEMNLSNLILATIVLVLLVFFLIYGSGKHSADYYLKMQK
ncbi:DoxX family protein [Arenibacter latericius]|uniref:DoxX family protein n=1 Tax=Arenibacter latericius TaxID=86104 RepID=UPI00041421D0|nr:DoxX family protein [Arenibacter latericius]MDX1365066.1 DoxX family protein [Arenibacter latericius]